MYSLSLLAWVYLSVSHLSVYYQATNNSLIRSIPRWNPAKKAGLDVYLFIQNSSICPQQFLPCDALHCTVFVIVILSVCLSVCQSVCLSVTLVDCVHTVRPTIMISSPYGNPIILVSGDITFIQKFEGGHPERGR